MVSTSHICEAGILVFRNVIIKSCSVQNCVSIINGLPKLVIWLTLMVRVTTVPMDFSKVDVFRNLWKERDSYKANIAEPFVLKLWSARDCPERFEIGLS